MYIKQYLNIAALVCIGIVSTTLHATEIKDFINQQNCDQVIDKGYYQICYDYKNKGAKYVGYTLDGSKVNAGNIKKRPRFYPDKSIPRKYRTTSKGYTKNEFHADRGHLLLMHHLIGQENRCTLFTLWPTLFHSTGGLIEGLG